MRLMRELDPDGVLRRRHHCLTRRIYLSKVHQYLNSIPTWRIVNLNNSPCTAASVCYAKYLSFYIQGSNYVWHLDGYDKLSPFGLCIHGCIDG